MYAGGDGWPLGVENTLEKTTGHKIPHKGGKPDQQAWLEYCEHLQL
jgi:hypothetical protein